MRKQLLVAITSVGVLVIADPVLADGGRTPSEAPTIALGQTYFGNAWRPRDRVYPKGDVWRLPPLLSGDAVTLAGATDPGQGNMGIGPCLTADADDYSYQQSLCNNGEATGETYYLGLQGARITLIAKRATSNALLSMYLENGCSSCSSGAPYHFVVESVQHAVGLGLPAVSSVSRKGQVRGSATLTNGAPVPDGLDVALIIRKNGKKWVRVARSTSGQITFRLGLPKAARGKVRLSLSRGADAQYLAASTQPTKTRIR